MLLTRSKRILYNGYVANTAMTLISCTEIRYTNKKGQILWKIEILCWQSM